MAALSRQNIQIPVETKQTWIVYDASHQENAIHIGQKLRKTGECVELMKVTADTTKEMYEASAVKHHVKDVIYCI